MPCLLRRIGLGRTFDPVMNQRDPMALGEVEEHEAVTASRDHATRRRRAVEPVFRQCTSSAILTAAERLFLQSGFDGVSMDMIAELAGVTKQTVYSYVGSKEAHFLDVVDRMTGGAGDELAEIVPQPSTGMPPERFLLEFAVKQLQIVVTPRLMNLRRVVIAERVRFPELGSLLHRRGPARSIDRLAAALADYAEAGALDLVDPRSAAAFFNWLVMGEPVNNAMLLGDQSIPDDSEKNNHAKECVRIFMAAYKPSSVA